MAFEKGQSGNLAGRPSGTKNWHTLLRDELRDDAPGLIKKLKDKALDGDVAALQFLLQAVLPRTKATAPLVSIPELEEAETLTGKAQAVLDAVAEGRLEPDVGTGLIAAINQTVKVVEVDDLAKRIEAIEGRLE